MTESDGQSPRERYRSQVRTEIKEHAWAQIAESGVPALSLNAIAKKMRLSGPALYRYFASRDELITALISDAYRSLAEQVQAAFADGADLHRLAHVIRDWAKADPQRYFLIYGTPVPGYHAPADTTAISVEIMTVLLAASSASVAAKPATPFDKYLETHRGWAENFSAEPTAMHRALAFWTRLHGVLSLELAGQFDGMRFDPGLLIDEELNSLLLRE